MWFHCVFPCDVGFGEVAVVLVVEDSVEYVVCAPWCAGADELAVCGSKSEEDGVVHFFVVGCEVHFVPVDEVQGWSSDGVGVVWETFYYAAVGEVDDGFSSLLI